LGVATLMVYAFVAAGLKVIPLTSVFADIETLVVLENANVAVSAELLGTVAGVQFVAVFQSPEVGLRSQVASPAKVVLGPESSNVIAASRLEGTQRPGVTRSIVFRDIMAVVAFIVLFSNWGSLLNVQMLVNIDFLIVERTGTRVRA